MSEDSAMSVLNNHPRASLMAAVLLAACLVILVVITTRERPALASATDHPVASDVAVVDDGWGPPGVDAAEAVMVAFARSTSDDPTWWPGVAGYLTPQARLDYLGVDPSLVPFTAVTGGGQALAYADVDGVEALVRVPTDAGDYLVRLRPADDGSFAVIALTPVDVEIPSDASSPAPVGTTAGVR
jgi:hypothetical protein